MKALLMLLLLYLNHNLLVTSCAIYRIIVKTPKKPMKKVTNPKLNKRHVVVNVTVQRKRTLKKMIC